MVHTWAIYPKLGYGMVQTLVGYGTNLGQLGVWYKPWYGMVQTWATLLAWERTQALQDSRSYISRYIRRSQKARGPCQLLEEVRGGEGRGLAVIEEEKVAWLAVLAPLM